MKTQLLNHKQIEQKINRIAYELYENNYEEKELIIAGIAERGYVLAQKLAKALQAITPIHIELVEIFVDRKNPIQEKVQIKLDSKTIENKVVIVVDDVLNSGKTLMYGVKYFLSIPVKKIATVVLIDRNHKQFPIQANFVGLSLATTMKEHVSVEFNKGNDAAYLQ